MGGKKIKRKRLPDIIQEGSKLCLLLGTKKPPSREPGVIFQIKIIRVINR